MKQNQKKVTIASSFKEVETEELLLNSTVFFTLQNWSTESRSGPGKLPFAHQEPLFHLHLASGSVPENVSNNLCLNFLEKFSFFPSVWAPHFMVT